MITTTIPLNGTDSSLTPVDLRGIVGKDGNLIYPRKIIMPAAWTTANLTVFISSDGGATYSELYDGVGQEFVIVAGVSRTILLDPSVFAGVDMFYFQSGVTGTLVTQTAAQVIGIIAK